MKMKFLIMVIIFILVPFAISKNTKNNFFPNLPFGEYKVIHKAILRCERTKEHAIELNFYINKISTNASEVRGNLTLKKTFDDSFYIPVNIAVKDSTGHWKENFWVHRVTKPCTFVKPFLVGAAWEMAKNNFDYYKYCPFPPGLYVSKGLDVTSFAAKLNVPKQFFYGTYKARIEIFESDGKLATCFQIIVDIKRPWETAD